MSIALHRNGSYDDMIASVIEADIGIDGSRPTWRINVNARPPTEPTNSFNEDNDSIGNERLSDHSKEILGDNSNESLGDHSINIHDDPINVENQSVDAEDSKPKCVTTNVNLLEKSCSCREYDLIKIPHAHTMAALRSKHGNENGISIYENSSPLYKVEAYLLAYMDSINVVPLESEWCVPEELHNVKILSPLVNTKLERKRRKRVKGVGENFKSK
uniref:Mutator-like transposase n=1 Tax=Solanum tuberosum TaxID=4113 RepID=M1E143_SOLTU